MKFQDKLKQKKDDSVSEKVSEKSVKSKLDLSLVGGVLNIIFFTFDGIGLSVAKKLIDEGNNVILAQIQNKKDIGEDGEEDKEMKRRRLSQYDGMIEKHDAMEVISKMKEIERKDEWIVFFDFNNLSVLAEKVLDMGFTKGMFPLIEDTELEKDRNKAKDIVKKYYKGLDVADVYEYKDIASAIEMLNETEQMFVLKGNSDGAKTVVPHNNDPELAKQIIIDALESHQKDYESEGFILEEKIVDGYELTPQIVFLDGKVVFTDIDIENKNIGAGNRSVQTGAMQTLVIKSEQKAKINQLAFPQWIYDKAMEHIGLFVADAGIICKDDKYYFTEFCFQRFGFDSFFAELAMSGSATDFFEKVFLKGQNPLVNNFGVAVRGLNMHKDDKERRVLEGVSMTTDDLENTWMFEVKAGEDDKLVSTGTCWDLVVFTGTADTIKEASRSAHEVSEHFAFEDLYIRPEFDFMSFDYQNSIPNRFTELNHKLFEAKDIEKDSTMTLKNEYDRKIKDLSDKIEKALKE